MHQYIKTHPDRMKVNTMGNDTKETALLRRTAGSTRSSCSYSNVGEMAMHRVKVRQYA